MHQAFEFSHSLTLVHWPHQPRARTDGGWYKDVSELACGRKTLEDLSFFFFFFFFLFAEGANIHVPMYLGALGHIKSETPVDLRHPTPKRSPMPPKSIHGIPVPPPCPLTTLMYDVVDEVPPMQCAD